VAESLEDYIARLRREHSASGKGSLEFYLSQIRELARQGQAAEQTKKTTAPSSADALATAAAKKDSITPSEARKQVMENAQETTSQVNRRMIGQMIFFNYDPKGKGTLPYYDTFPLVFPFTIAGNSMTGMNMHYLPPVERARLMMALSSVVSTHRADEHTRLIISYKILSGSSKYAYFRPCIKKYLLSNIRSRLMVISPPKWNSVLFMPLANFMKSSEYHVWQDSVNTIRKAAFHDR
jgi:hypothetical protein